MLVAIIAPEGLPVPPAQGGSVQIYLNSLIPKFAGRENLELTLLSPGAEKSRLRMRGLTHTVYDRHARANSSYETWVLRQIARLAPDVIQVENRPILATRILKLRDTTPSLAHSKVVLNLHSTTFLGPMHGKQGTVRKCLQSVDAVVLNSRYLKRKVASRFNLASGSWNPHVIYPGVDTRRFFSSSTGMHQPLRLIFIGRVIQLKGVTVLISAVRHMVEQKIPVSLTIVGKTPPWEHQYGVKAKQASRGLPVVWKGFVKPAVLPKVLAEHDVLICPSQRREAFGLVNLEAMAAGKPVVASRVGGIPEVVNTSSGVLVDSYKSPAAFAKAITRLIKHPQEYATLQEGAKKRAKEFSWSNTAAAFHRLYQGLR